jgi:hypothetical protein
MQVWLATRDLSGNYGTLVTLTVATPDVLGPSFVTSTPRVEHTLELDAGSPTVAVDVALDEPGNVTCVLDTCFRAFDDDLCLSQVEPLTLSLLEGDVAGSLGKASAPVPKANEITTIGLSTATQVRQRA